MAYFTFGAAVWKTQASFPTTSQGSGNTAKQYGQTRLILLELKDSPVIF
jgi:hypothetical protein